MNREYNCKKIAIIGLVEKPKGCVFMVKGVNKKIIEINNTENEFFEKIVLYVSPKATAINSIKVKKAVDMVVKSLSATSPNNTSLREILNAKKRRKRITLILCAVLALLSGTLIMILL